MNKKTKRALAAKVAPGELQNAAAVVTAAIEMSRTSHQPASHCLAMILETVERFRSLPPIKQPKPIEPEEPDPEYRTLTPGTRLARGDEFLANGVWGPTRDVGRFLRDIDKLQYRRKVDGR